ncbi:hypothetical protein Godav_029441 [Gossypium davidsonii]|uniref:Uncharacterized protein n=2 Tax=Gossypium TaxID=3633 RepID=A0A7J8TD75_GOSDV|nr:hypothetical protein [Gossypium davidsonii]MBA0673653.1 hypothetical protein [Gossypium klotzschianum]
MQLNADHILRISLTHEDFLIWGGEPSGGSRFVAPTNYYKKFGGS